MADARTGGAMAKWTVKDRIPKGVPKNLPVYVGLGLSAFVIVAMLLTTGDGSSVPPEEGDPLMDGATVTGSDVERLVSAVTAEARRAREAQAEAARAQALLQRRQREDEDRRLEAERAESREELAAARAALERAAQLRAQNDLAPDERRQLLGAVGSVEEEELRAAIRLAEVERFANSMRAPAMVGAGAVAAQAAPVAASRPESEIERLVRLAQEAEAAQGTAGSASGGARPGAPPLREGSASGEAAMDAVPPGREGAAGDPVDVYPPLAPAGGGGAVRRELGGGRAVGRGPGGGRPRLPGTDVAGDAPDAIDGGVHGSGPGARVDRGVVPGPAARGDSAGHACARRGAAGDGRVPGPSGGGFRPSRVP